MAASQPASNEGDVKRPSRLLNLNKSPKAQKLLYVLTFARGHHTHVANTVDSSAAKNAVDSPLLRLPAEVRCRIYDYAFGSCTVHVNLDFHYCTLTNCTSPQDCEAPLLQRRIQRISLYDDPPEGRSATYEDCKKPVGRQNVGSCKIPVHMLQACRQMYHEAALKPFTEASFHFVLARKECSSGLKLFLDSLVPTQARAIAHLRFSLLRDQFLSSAIPSQLKGLKHVEIHIATYAMWPWYGDDEPLVQLQDFEDGPGFRTLKKLDLKSLRFTVSIQSVQPTEASKASILEWMGRLEVGVTHALQSEHQETTDVTEPL
jgi:hypothetical protein